jgi:hypothetical protein
MRLARRVGPARQLAQDVDGFVISDMFQHLNGTRRPQRLACQQVRFHRVRDDRLIELPLAQQLPAGRLPELQRLAGGGDERFTVGKLGDGGDAGRTAVPQTRGADACDSPGGQRVAENVVARTGALPERMARAKSRHP